MALVLEDIIRPKDAYGHGGVRNVEGPSRHSCRAVKRDDTGMTIRTDTASLMSFSRGFEKEMGRDGLGCGFSAKSYRCR